MQEDSDRDGYVSCLQVLLALKTIIPPELLSDQEEIYVYRVDLKHTHTHTNSHPHTRCCNTSTFAFFFFKILEMVDFRVTDGLVDLRLFAVIASLAQKIASME